MDFYILQDLWTHYLHIDFQYDSEECLNHQKPLLTGNIENMTTCYTRHTQLCERFP
jgi:hypothetical protein